MSFIRPGRSAEAAPAPPPPGGDITPSLVVEYVDTSGVLQTTTVVDGVTSISGVAPFLVHFDASGTRSVVAADARAGWEAVGYQITYGEALGTNWTYGGGTSRDEDTGPPVFGRAFTTTGTKTVRLRCKDANSNETTISLSVVVSAPPTATNITAGTSWPTWASSTHYTLNRGSDYTSHGAINLNGLHNVLISATGSGADPIVGTVNMDTRAIISTVADRSSNNRLLNIDIAAFGIGTLLGGLYCGAVFGRVRTMLDNGYSGSNASYYYTNEATTSTERNNIKYPRGVFFWDCGEVNPPAGSDYIMISGNRNFHAYGVVFHKNGTAGQHTLRNNHDSSSYRYCNLYASVATVTHMKMQSGGTTSRLAGDEFGDPSGSGAYLVSHAKVAVYQNQFGRSGETRPDLCITVGPENAENPQQGHEYIAIENNIGFNATSWQATAGLDTQFGGRYLSNRNNRMNAGAGSYATTGFLWAGDGLTWDGPYLTETTNTRPVPTAF